MRRNEPCRDKWYIRRAVMGTLAHRCTIVCGVCFPPFFVWVFWCVCALSHQSHFLTIIYNKELLKFDFWDLPSSFFRYPQEYVCIMIIYSSEKPEGLCHVVYIRKWNRDVKSRSHHLAAAIWLMIHHRSFIPHLTSSIWSYWLRAAL